MEVKRLTWGNGKKSGRPFSPSEHGRPTEKKMWERPLRRMMGQKGKESARGKKMNRKGDFSVLVGQ